MKFFPSFSFLILALASCSLILAGCGGGGSGSATLSGSAGTANTTLLIDAGSPEPAGGSGGVRYDDDHIVPFEEIESLTVTLTEVAFHSVGGSGLRISRRRGVCSGRSV